MIFFLRCLGSLIFISCILGCEGSSYTQEQLDSLDRAAAIQELIKEWKDKEKEGRKKRQERNNAGDTTAMDAKLLKSFLPQRYEGYSLTEDFSEMPYGASGEAYASVEQTYVKGNSHLRITLSDYNGQEAKLAESTAIWSIYPRSDTESELTQGITMHDSMIGWEIYLKNSQRAELTLAISDRILLTIIADQQEDTEFIKSLAQAIDLLELAKF